MDTLTESCFLRQDIAQLVQSFLSIYYFGTQRSSQLRRQPEGTTKDPSAMSSTAEIYFCIVRTKLIKKQDWRTWLQYFVSTQKFSRSLSCGMMRRTLMGDRTPCTGASGFVTFHQNIYYILAQTYSRFSALNRTDATNWPMHSVK